MKIIVKLGIEPEQKEVFTAEQLDVLRIGSDTHPILIIKDSKTNVVLGEFTNWLCWVRGEDGK